MTYLCHINYNKYKNECLCDKTEMLLSPGMLICQCCSHFVESCASVIINVLKYAIIFSREPCINMHII